MTRCDHETNGNVSRFDDFTSLVFPAPIDVWSSACEILLFRIRSLIFDHV